MAKITILGRMGQVIYGQYASLSFQVDRVTRYINNINGAFVVGEDDSTFTPGSMTVLGTSVTLTATDCLSEASVAAKIASSVTAGTVYSCYSINNVVYAQYQTAVGPIARPTIASYFAATQVCISDFNFIQGVAMPSTGAQDDIKICGKTPVTVQVAFTGGTQPTLFGAIGSDADQALGKLVYNSITLTNGIATLTTPYDFIRVTTISGNTQVIVSVAR